MSKYNQTVRLEVPADELLVLCQKVFQEFGWRVQEVRRSGITAKEVVGQVTGFTFPARIDLQIKTRADGSSELQISGSISGLGPIQSNHLKGQVGRFLNSLSLKIDTAKSERAHSVVPASLSSQLRDLAELHSSGVLTDDEFQVAKARLLGS